jgi:hypothetical protein
MIPKIKNLVKLNVLFQISLASLIFVSCSKTQHTEKTVTLKSDPLFPNSIVSNNINFILETDSNTLIRIDYKGQQDNEMPDSRTDVLFDENSYIFEASFVGNVKTEIWCHSNFGSVLAAQEYVEKLGRCLGKIPVFQINMLDHVVIHKGDATAFAETEGQFFVLYSDNMDKRISTNDLEETVFHESIHATIQNIYETSADWKNAQIADGKFITEYAKRLPSLEDMPETALFAYTMINYPGRMPLYIEKWINENIPNRLAFFKTIYQ